MLKDFFGNFFTKSIIHRVDNQNIPKNTPWSNPTLDKAALLDYNKNYASICANYNAVSVAQTPLRIFAWDRGGRQLRGYESRRLEQKEIQTRFKSRSKIQTNSDAVYELFNHPLNYLLEKPNDWLDNFSFLEMLTKYMDFTGNAYIYVNKKLGVIDSLDLMNPALTQVIPGEKVLIKGYIYGRAAVNWGGTLEPSKQGIALPRKDVVRFYVSNPSSAIEGASVIEQHIGSLSRMDLYDIYENSNLKNNARPDFIVKYGKKLDMPTLKQLNLEWNRMYKGPNNAGQVRVMDSEFDIDKLSFAPKDMEFLESRKVTVRQICNAFGVPYALIDSSDQLKAGLDNILPLYQKYAIQPRLKRIESALNEQLCPMFDDTGRLFVAFDNPIDDDKRFNLLQSSNLYKSGIIDRNEAREMVGLSAVENEVVENEVVENGETNEG